MSQYSAPSYYYRPTPKFSPPPLRTRGRSHTFPNSPDAVPASKITQPISNHYKDEKIYDSNRMKRQQPQISTSGLCFRDEISPLQIVSRKYSTESENGNEKWEQLNHMTKEVNHMKEIVDQLFPGVKIQPINDLKDYSGCSEYEYQVESLRNVIYEQISRMKAFWCGEESMGRDDSTLTDEQYQIERLRHTMREMFNRMKKVVDGLIPPENSQQKQTRSWIEDLKCQLTNLDVSIKGFVKSISCDSFQSDSDSPLSDSMSDSCAMVRIKELEDQLEASLKREEGLKLKLKHLEVRHEKDIMKMDEQIQELQQMLNRANIRAQNSRDEAYELKYKLVEMEVAVMELGLAERTARRGDQMRPRSGYMRTSPSTEYTNKHTSEVVQQNREFEKPRSPIPTSLRTENVYDQPKPIPVSRLRRMTSITDRRNSTTIGQGSRVVSSPKERKISTPWKNVPNPEYYYRDANEHINIQQQQQQQQQHQFESM